MVSEAMQKERMLSVKDVAETLSISENTVRRWITEGKLKGLKFGRQWRFKPSDIQGWIEHGDRPEHKKNEKELSEEEFSLEGMFARGDPIPKEAIDEVIKRYS